MHADKQRAVHGKTRKLGTVLSRFKNTVPTREALAARPWLKPIAHRVLDRQLWRLQHEAVARGVAIGIFWAFAIPFAQFAAAIVHSIWWRANIPVAVGMTLVTNPLTIGFWLWLAHRLGSWLLGVPPQVFPTEGARLTDWLASFGASALLGMGTFSLAGALVGYLGVKLVWRLRVARKRRRRRQIRRTPSN